MTPMPWLFEHGVVDAAPCQQAAVNVRMQRLDAAVHDLREARDRRDVGHGDSRGAQRFRGAARRHDLEAQRSSASGERREPLLVRDAEQRAGVSQRRLSGASEPPRVVPCAVVAVLRLGLIDPGACSL